MALLNRRYTDLTATIITTTINDYGVEVPSEEDVTIKGLINQIGSKEIEWAKARNIEVDYKAFVEVTATTQALKKNDLINGYRIVSKPKNTISRNHHLLIMLQEVV